MKSVQTQVFHGNQKGGANALEAAKFNEAKEKKKKEENAKLLASLFMGAKDANKAGEEITQNS